MRLQQKKMKLRIWRTLYANDTISVINDTVRWRSQKIIGQKINYNLKTSSDIVFPDFSLRDLDSNKLKEKQKIQITSKWAINIFQPMKILGVDGLFPALVQKEQDVILQHLLRISWTSLELEYILDDGRNDTTPPKF